MCLRVLFPNVLKKTRFGNENYSNAFGPKKDRCPVGTAILIWIKVSSLSKQWESVDFVRGISLTEGEGDKLDSVQQILGHYSPPVASIAFLAVRRHRSSKPLPQSSWRRYGRSTCKTPDACNSVMYRSGTQNRPSCERCERRSY